MSNDMYSVYKDADVFTDLMINLTRNGMQSQKLAATQLSEFVENIVRIINLDVEDRMEVYTAPSGKQVIILFANDTQIGLNSAYYTERIFAKDHKVDIIVLPGDHLLNRINNAEILESLDRVYAFILETKKVSSEYISPFEIFKHMYARLFFETKYFMNTFTMDEKTTNDLIEFIKGGSDGIVDYQCIFDDVNLNHSVEALFDENEVLCACNSEIYYEIIDQLSAEFQEEDE